MIAVLSLSTGMFISVTLSVERDVGDHFVTMSKQGSVSRKKSEPPLGPLAFSARPGVHLIATSHSYSQLTC